MCRKSAQDRITLQTENPHFPLDPIAGYDQQRRCFCLGVSVRLNGSHQIREKSEKMKSLHTHYIKQKPSETQRFCREVSGILEV